MREVQSLEFRVQSWGNSIQSLDSNILSFQSQFSVVSSIGHRVSSTQNRIIFVLLLLCSYLSVSAQEDAYLYHLNPYNFIRYDLNSMHYPGNKDAFDRLDNKLEHLMTTGEGRINIVHIGGSHIQAGSFTGQMRTRFQQLTGGMNAGWGFMFPYRISRTNSPFGYYIRYNGSWQSFRNVESRKRGTLGVGGISVTTSSPRAELTILLEKENTLDYSFNKFRIYYANRQKNYDVEIDTGLVKTVEKTDDYIDFSLNRRVDSLQINLVKQAGKAGSFTLYGITTETAPNGIMYHAIGVNGAHVPAYLRCQLFTEQLADLKPDLVILGIGINDAYTRRFSQERFESNYDQLITEIRQAAPGAAIIFTTNNDSYLYRRYVNKNGEKVRESMFRMAQKYNAGVWDMFEVMGGLNSIV
ncbi:MAG TPA: GDSL-type esterase/lipase family protein, partial [Draconibacterium sp.]|nr:GDSL-type esterase/lipase family protein [Draconibacterium sp.]